MLRTDDAGRRTMDAGRWTLDAGSSTPYYKLTGELKKQFKNYTFQETEEKHNPFRLVLVLPFLKQNIPFRKSESEIMAFLPLKFVHVLYPI